MYFLRSPRDLFARSDFVNYGTVGGGLLPPTVSYRTRSIETLYGSILFGVLGPALAVSSLVQGIENVT